MLLPMCGRFTLTVHQLGSVAVQLDALFDEEHGPHYRARFNVAPGDAHWIVRMQDGRRHLVPAGWGLINHWAKDTSAAFKQINARSETLAQRPAYREAYRARRCVVPADGFYEWRGPRKAREPVWFHSPAGGMLWFAGLYEGWRDPQSGEQRCTFTIITTPANALVRQVHDRMPAILPLERVAAWLAGEESETLLSAAAEDVLAMQPASLRVNSAKHDDADLLNVDDPAVARQLRLF